MLEWTSFKFELVSQVMVQLLMMVQNEFALLGMKSFKHQSSLESHSTTHLMLPSKKHIAYVDVTDTFSIMMRVS